MKLMLAICMMVAAPFVLAAEKSAPATPANTVVKGVVLEVKDTPSFTYLRLRTKDGETWAAVGKASVKKGTEVTIENVILMKDFESKALKQTFPTIVLGNLAGAAGSAPAGGDSMMPPHAASPRPADTADVHVPKASGPDARTVAEIMTKGAELKDKPVLVRGKVVKYNAGIMGRNWIHLRDGSGSAADQTNDVLVTSANEVKLGDVVTMKGIVRTDKNFGAGYSYKVLVEEATLQR